MMLIFRGVDASAITRLPLRRLPLRHADIQALATEFIAPRRRYAAILLNAEACRRLPRLP